MNAFLNREEKMKYISKATPMKVKPRKENIRTTGNSYLLSVSSLILLPQPTKLSLPNRVVVLSLQGLQCNWYH